MPIDFPIMKIFPFSKKAACFASVVILLTAQPFFNLLLMETGTSKNKQTNKQTNKQLTKKYRLNKIVVYSQMSKTLNSATKLDNYIYIFKKTQEFDAKI